MNRSKVALFGKGGVPPHGNLSVFAFCLFLRVRTGCEGRLTVQKWRVGDWDEGLGTGLPGLGYAALPERGPSS